LVRRDNGAKLDVSVDNLGAYIATLLEEIQMSLFEKSKRERDEKIVQVLEWKDFVPALNRQCLVLTPFCDLTEWEEKVKV
jgi:prolyl-tRNA synthetase